MQSNGQSLDHLQASFGLGTGSDYFRVGTRLVVGGAGQTTPLSGWGGAASAAPPHSSRSGLAGAGSAEPGSPERVGDPEFSRGEEVGTLEPKPGQSGSSGAGDAG